MRHIFLFILFVLLGSVVLSNNIKVNSEAKVVSFLGAAKDTAVVEFSLSWDNSWRDDFNWDAAWIFLKYKKRGADQVWHHAYLCREGHTATPISGNEGGDYTFMFGEVGSGAAKVTGIYMMRDGIGEGKVCTKVQVKWPIKSNATAPLSASDFGADRDSVYVASYVTEMVYVPYGGYALGDNFSSGAFVNSSGGPIPPAQDLIDLKSGYVYSTNYVKSSGDGTGTPSSVADRSPESLWPTSSFYYHVPAYWQVDFKTPKEIKYFGIASANNYSNNSSDCTPNGPWYLQGSNDLKTWTNVYVGSGISGWVYTTVSYPVSKSIRVGNPGAYRYYRLQINASNRSDNGIVIQSIAMTEVDLYPDGYNVTIESENEISLGNDFMASDGQAWTGKLPVSYPKGFRGFYVMKYEASQEQYAGFLNSLTLAQQKSRVANSNFEKMVKGDYVFGSLKRPNNRNGIAFVGLTNGGKTAVFGNNLNPDNKFHADDDGQNLACNYLSPADMLAYCDWAGLRPMSEMEYEKACRRPTPQIPDKGEYAWNSNAGVKPLRSLSDLSGTQTERESPFDYTMNVNSGDKLNGPVRNGAFATSRTGQLESGGTYWGVMEMSGNLWEMCYTANAGGRTFVADNANSHGDGELSTAIAATTWPAAVGAMALRGGSFKSANPYLRTSDRSYASGTYFKTMELRDSTVGFRAARGVLNTTGFAGGELYCRNGNKADTICPNAEYTIRGEAAQNGVGKLTYTWYKSEDNGNIWNLLEGENGLSLTYRNFMNTSTAIKAWRFKRKAICAVGEEETVPVVLSIVPELKKPTLSRYEITPGLGYKFVLPSPLDNSIASRWTYPSGKDVAQADAFVDNYAVGDDGVYKLYYVEEHGCESEKVEVKITGTKAVVLSDYGTYKGWSDGSFARSAKEYLNPEYPYIYTGATGSGIYRIQPKGAGTAAINAYCDMTTSGGGWTMVVAQFELDPVKSWNEGIQADYDPSLNTSKSFIFNTAQLPPHTQTAWGKQLDPTFIGYSNFLYTTGDIAVTTVMNIKTGNNFHIYRSVSYYYSYHDPEYSSPGSHTGWNNTLTYDQTGGTCYSWSFSPNYPTVSERGFGMAGNVRYNADAYAWTVWVR